MQVHKALSSLKKPLPYKATINFKVVESEAKEIKEIAKKYTKGNVTSLIRIAVKNFKPSSKELVTLKTKTAKVKVAKPAKSAKKKK